MLFDLTLNPSPEREGLDPIGNFHEGKSFSNFFLAARALRSAKDNLVLQLVCFLVWLRPR